MEGQKQSAVILKFDKYTYYSLLIVGIQVILSYLTRFESGDTILVNPYSPIMWIQYIGYGAIIIRKIGRFEMKRVRMWFWIMGLIAIASQLVAIASLILIASLP